ncbi:MAG: bifunctional phosphoribosyl-AMP cyclohydrolase/phosphoribosyl-ATP diphosphatase HisIE [Bacillota bacterium]
MRPNFDEKGLVPAVVQDQDTGEVIMLAHMNDEAWEKTLNEGAAYFFSRKRQRLWKKGETSGHIIRVNGIFLDCDADAVLILGKAHGPACHTGARSCFFNGVRGNNVPVLPELSRVVESRASTPDADSYTARLFHGGLNACAKKVGEEAVEVVLAAAREDAARLVEECADLLYHVTVLLRLRGCSLEAVLEELGKRRRGNTCA